MTTPIGVSVVISTHNRAAVLSRALDALLAQTGVAYEVIAVDNASTDGTAGVIQSMLNTGSAQLRYVCEPRKGLPYARNARRARGERADHRVHR